MNIAARKMSLNKKKSQNSRLILFSSPSQSSKVLCRFFTWAEKNIFFLDFLPQKDRNIVIACERLSWSFFRWLIYLQIRRDLLRRFFLSLSKEAMKIAPNCARPTFPEIIFAFSSLQLRRTIQIFLLKLYIASAGSFSIRVNFYLTLSF